MHAQDPRVDFGYAFAPPHRLTVARPDSAHKTLLDLQPGSLRMTWSYDDLTQYPPAAFKTPPTAWGITFHAEVDGHSFGTSAWTRADGWIPALKNVYDDHAGHMEIEVVGCATAAALHIRLRNPGPKPQQYAVRLESSSWGENPAWVDPTAPGDHLVAGWNERADRVLILGIGADAWSNKAGERPPGPRQMLMLWNVRPGEERTAWVVRPYRAYAADVPALRIHNWTGEVAAAKEEWAALIARTARVLIPDRGVADAYRACLADLFIMREPIGRGYVAATPGTEVYRAPNAFEAAISAIAIDQAGLHREAERGYRMPLEMQEADGNWADPRGWGHLMWGNSGFKAWAAMEHYRLTNDRRYLSKVYPRLAASSRWQERQRAKMRAGDPQTNVTYGLMPRGMGDAGLKDDDDLYGIFLPHNIWAVYADRLAVDAAEILGRAEDLPELRRIYETGRTDLLRALERGSILDKGYRWIPAVPGKTSGSLWGGLNALFPCALLSADHPLIDGTIRHMESRLSPGGIPVHTGWLADGMWVAITLDNLAEAHLARGNGDAAARYLYAVLNHGTPLYTWCEERGQEAGTTQCTGDRQHLWTPVAVVRSIRDSLVMEQSDGLHLGLGMDRSWLGSGRSVGISGAPTHFGRISWEARLESGAGRVVGCFSLARGASARRVVLHVRLPNGRRVKSVDPKSGATVLPDGAGIVWDSPRGARHFVATVD